MKTLKKGDEIRRVTDIEAKLLIKNAGYTYCKKSVWKKVRGTVAQPVSKKNVDQPWKDKRKQKEVKIVDGAVVKEEKPVVKELTAADVMAGGDKAMVQAMEITSQEDKKGKKTNKKSKK